VAVDWYKYSYTMVDNTKWISSVAHDSMSQALEAALRGSKTRKGEVEFIEIVPKKLLGV